MPEVLRFLVLAALVLTPLASASGTSVLYFTDAEQARLSSAVVVATVGSARQEVHPRYQRPMTYTSFQIDEVLYAYTTASASLIETSDGQVRHTVTKKDIKGAHYAELEKIRYGPNTALEISLKQAVVELHDAMRDWKN